jgi:hypothetical protein
MGGQTAPTRYQDATIISLVSTRNQTLILSFYLGMSQQKNVPLRDVIHPVLLCGLLIVTVALSFVWKNKTEIPSIVACRRFAMPVPNAHDTLAVAAKLKVDALGDIAASPRPKPLYEGSMGGLPSGYAPTDIEPVTPPTPVPSPQPTPKPISISDQPMAGRLKLLRANEKFIATLRTALTQKHAEPSLDADGMGNPNYKNLAQILYFAGVTYADQKNYPEASRCFLDAIELGTLLGQRNALSGTISGIICMEVGQKGLWEITDKLDAKTAKNASIRLQKIAATRAPFSDTLNEEKRIGMRRVHGFVRGNPLEMANRYASLFRPCYAGGGDDERNTRPNTTLMSWVMVGNVIWAGKSNAILDYEMLMNKEIQYAEQSYAPNVPRLEGKTLVSSNLFNSMEDMRFRSQRNKAEDNLLTTYLAIHAFQKEKGKLPDNLEMLSLGKSAIDNFSGVAQKPFVYQKTANNTFLLYSVGPDGQDNKGIAIDPYSIPNSKDKRKEPRRSISSKDKGDIIPHINTY